ncbi:hypothetical protein GCM10020000_16720 [Streptomyces olivoverticillatus]
MAASYAGVVAPPLVIGAYVGLSPAELAFLVGASLFTAGLATLLQTVGFWKVGVRLPFVNGVSFAGVAPPCSPSPTPSTTSATRCPSSTAPSWWPGRWAFCSPPPWFCKLVRFFPPVVSGTVITLIGLTLLPVSFGWIQGGHPERPAPPVNLALAGATLLIVLVLRRLLKGFG